MRELDLPIIDSLPAMLDDRSRRAAIHSALTKTLTRLMRYGWKHNWGYTDTSPGCVFHHLGVVLGYAPATSRVVSHPLAYSCARAMGFASVGEGMKWNDRQTLLSVIMRLERAIEATLPHEGKALTSPRTRPATITVTAPATREPLSV